MSIQTALVGEFGVEVSIADSGTGIPADKLNAVFDTFYTTKRQGTGLGLSISRTIVETYGGRIWAENRPGGGAAFRFTLPLSKEFPHDQHTSEHSASSTTMRRFGQPSALSSRRAATRSHSMNQRAQLAGGAVGTVSRPAFCWMCRWPA